MKILTILIALLALLTMACSNYTELEVFETEFQTEYTDKEGYPWTVCYGERRSGTKDWHYGNPQNVEDWEPQQHSIPHLKGVECFGFKDQNARSKHSQEYTKGQY